MIWSPEQEGALRAVAKWLRLRNAPYFYLAGYAGTGKTTLAKHLAKDAGKVLYGSFTGKAAAVMRERGCHNATTIHRLIYTSRTKGTARYEELRKLLQASASDDERARLSRAIREEIKSLRAPLFRINPDSDVQSADLVVIDECSMVGERMGTDLLSFRTPVLVLGDPAQLPPVGAGGYFTAQEPDHMLTEVHRQAQESGILQLATAVRRGQEVPYCELNDARVVQRSEFDPETVQEYDQILVGRNASRQIANTRMRERMQRQTLLPEAGDRLVCLRNNHELGLLNGEIWNTLDAEIIDDERIGLTIESDGMDAQNVEAWRHPFEGAQVRHWDFDQDVQEFDYGYALTVHKAQGSEWPRVLVLDESRFFRANANRWLYTAITRANNRLTLVR